MATGSHNDLKGRRFAEIALRTRYRASRTGGIRTRGREASPRPREPETGAPKLRDLLANVNAASNDARNAWIAALGILAYLLVTLVGVTHKDLLLDSPTQLPFVNVGIPLKGFFIFGPLVLVFLHFGLLLQHAMLHKKLEGFNKAVAEAGVPLAENGRDIREELHSYFLTQAFAGKEDDRTLVRAFRVMSAASFTLAPLALLLYFQIKFLPLHDEETTWLHRLCLAGDAALLWSVGAFLREARHGAKATVWSVLGRRVIPPCTIGIAALFSLTVATFPHEWADKAMTRIGPRVAVPIQCGEDIPSHRHEAFWPTAWLFERKAQPEQSRACSAMRWLSGSRNLDVFDLDLVPDNKVVEGEATLRLRNRDFRYADFSRSDLKQADFGYADLRDADLNATELSHTTFTGAQLQGAHLIIAQLQGANLIGAQLQGAYLQGAQLQGAKLVNAQLQVADLKLANLQGASLVGAALWENEAPVVSLLVYSDASFISFRAPKADATDRDLQKLASEMTAKKTPGHEAVAAVAYKLTALQEERSRARKSKSWTDEEAFCAWSALRDRKDRPEERGRYLGRMACRDRAEKVFFATGLVRNWKSSPSEAKALLEELASCPAVRDKLPADDLKRLEDKAKELLQAKVPVKWLPEWGVSPEEARAICKRRARKARSARR